MIKVDVISGFLGAGKTTLIKKLYSDVFKSEKVVLIENEFGEIGIDGAFLKESGIEIKEINSGCICCSLVGDFSTSMKEVVEKFNPERIIIEPSGVGKLSDILKAIEKVDEDLAVNVVVTVVDGGKCKMYHKNFGEFYNDQVENANVVVMSKTEKLSEEKIIDGAALIKMINGEALIVTTPVEDLDGVKLLKTFENIRKFRENFMKEERCCCGHHHDHEHHDHDCGCHHDHEHHDHDCDCHHDHKHHDHDCGCHHDHEHHDHDHDHHHHHADEVFTAWGVETAKKYTAEDIHNALKALDSGKYGMILRAKGIVAAADGSWIHFDYVPEEHDVRTGSAAVIGKLCVIGSKLDEQAVAALFGV